KYGFKCGRQIKRTIPKGEAGYISLQNLAAAGLQTLTIDPLSLFYGYFRIIQSSNSCSRIFSQKRTNDPTAAAAQLRNLGRTCFRQMTKAPIREGGMGMVHTAHHTLAQQTFRLAGIIEKSLPYPHNCLQKLKFRLAKTNYTHYTSYYTETQQTRAFSDHFALWKCGKRLLRR